MEWHCSKYLVAITQEDKGRRLVVVYIRTVLLSQLYIHTVINILNLFYNVPSSDIFACQIEAQVFVAAYY